MMFYIPELIKLRIEEKYTPFVLVGTKSDANKGKSMKSYNLQDFENEFHLYQGYHFSYVECSAKWNINVNLPFDHLIQLLRYQRIKKDKIINDLRDKVVQLRNIQFRFY